MGRRSIGCNQSHDKLGEGALGPNGGVGWGGQVIVSVVSALREPVQHTGQPGLRPCRGQGKQVG